MEIINEEIKRKISNKGITLIALVVTIIILLILAGVTIAMLTSENGILSKVQDAKNTTQIESERELIKRAVIASKISETNYMELEEGKFRIELEREQERIDLSVIGENFEVYFRDTNRCYEVDKYGNVWDYEIIGEITQAGDITKGNTLDGSKDKPYEINCIEDLIELSYAVNGITVNDEGGLEKTNDGESFLDKQFVLKNNLNFLSRYSYEDYQRTDYGDINGNGTVEDIVTELSSEEGFLPIGKQETPFSGDFDGNSKKIKNLYIKRQGAVGTFGYIHCASVMNLETSGKVISLNSIAGGIIGVLYNIKKYSGEDYQNIYNCKNNCYVEGYSDAGGIIGRLTGNSRIRKSISIY